MSKFFSILVGLCAAFVTATEISEYETTREEFGQCLATASDITDDTIAVCLGTPLSSVDVCPLKCT